MPTPFQPPPLSAKCARFSVPILAWPPALYAAGLAGAALLGLNAPLYRFFQRKRGWRFALRTVLWHWLYYLYGSAAFAYVRLADRHYSEPPPRLMMGEANHTPPTHEQ